VIVVQPDTVGCWHRHMAPAPLDANARPEHVQPGTTAAIRNPVGQMTRGKSWQRRLIAQQYDRSARRGPGRPPVIAEIRAR
jgi:hypothetical protein